MSQEKLEYKARLKAYCTDIIQQRLQRAKDLMSETQEAANQEEKSSAGDKYETSRAMSHLAKDMHSRQLAEYMKELASLHTINVTVIYDQVSPGAVVIGASFAFFIAAGLGKQVFDGKAIIFLSPQAPLASALLNKKAGDAFVFSGKEDRIVEVY